MKLLSILLRLVAIAGAAFCVYAWLDTKGKTSESMEHMKDIAGETLQARTAQVPGILKEKAKTESDLRKTKQDLASTQETLAETKNELADANDKIVQALDEIEAKKVQIGTLTASVESLEKTVASSEVEVKDLKNEIVKIKSDTEPLIASLNAQIQTLEADLANKDLEKAEAVAAVEKELNEKMEQMVMPTVAEEEEPAAPIYIAKGEIITVLKVSDDNAFFVINRGSQNGFKQNQRFKIKDEGNFIAELTVSVLQNHTAVCSIADKNIGIPETIFVGDSYEVAVEALDQGEAPAAEISEEDVVEDAEDEIETEAI